MSANLKILNALLGVLQPMMASPDAAVSTAAGEEMQELLKRRQKLLGTRKSTEDAGRKVAVSA